VWNLELVGESRNFDPIDLMHISTRFADIYRFYSTGLTTKCWGLADVLTNCISVVIVTMATYVL
jgi:hypothetical protein